MRTTYVDHMKAQGILSMILLLHTFCRPRNYLHKQSLKLPNSVEDRDFKTVTLFQKAKPGWRDCLGLRGVLYLQRHVCPISLSLAQYKNEL